MGFLACTEGKFILTAAKWFLEQGGHVSIGDSPAFGTTTSVLRKLGIIDDLRALGVGVTNFNKVRQVALPSGLKVGMASDAFDCELLVNMPRVKAHAQLRVSLAVKNLFGCVAGMRKPLWHMVHGGCDGRFAEYLVELMAVLARAAGHRHLSDFNMDDLTTFNSDMCSLTGVAYGGIGR